MKGPELDPFLTGQSQVGNFLAGAILTNYYSVSRQVGY